MMIERRADPWWSTFFDGPWGALQAHGDRAELAHDEVDFVLQELALVPGARVLDLPCGAGRHSLELAARGFRVTGLDINARSIAAAKQHASARDLDVRFGVADMRHTGLDAVFDAVLCFFGSFGYFDDEENLAFLEHAGALLVPGGRLLLDVHVAESLLPHFPTERSYEAGDARIDEQSSWDHELGRFVTRWTFTRAGACEQYESSVRIYPYRALCELLQHAGFGELRGVETSTGARFSLGCERLSLLAQKARA